MTKRYTYDDLVRMGFKFDFNKYFDRLQRIIKEDYECRGKVLKTQIQNATGRQQADAFTKRTQAAHYAYADKMEKEIMGRRDKDLQAAGDRFLREWEAKTEAEAALKPAVQTEESRRREEERRRRIAEEMSRLQEIRKKTQTRRGKKETCRRK